MLWELIVAELVVEVCMKDMYRLSHASTVVGNDKGCHVGSEVICESISKWSLKVNVAGGSACSK